MQARKQAAAPAWLASAKDRSKFLIDATSAVAVNASSASKAKPAAKTVVAKKPAAKKAVTQRCRLGKLLQRKRCRLQARRHRGIMHR
jgi:hypothetical protein